MLKVVKWLAIVLGVLVLAFIIIGFLLPSSYSLERSIIINAPPERIHQLIGDVQRWPEWDPWLELDPTIQTTYGAITTGVGANQSWTGESGGGELTVTSSDPMTGIVYEMTFDGGFASEGFMRYEVTPEGTLVTWGMDGEMDNFIARYLGVMMDTMVGPPFEVGLGKLKDAAESLPAMDAPVEEEPEGAEAVG